MGTLRERKGRHLFWQKEKRGLIISKGKEIEINYGGSFFSFHNNIGNYNIWRKYSSKWKECIYYVPIFGAIQGLQLVGEKCMEEAARNCTALNFFHLVGEELKE